MRVELTIEDDELVLTLLDNDGFVISTSYLPLEELREALDDGPRN